MNVTELIAELQQVSDPDNTEAVVTASEHDMESEFVALDEIIHAYGGGGF